MESKLITYTEINSTNMEAERLITNGIIKSTCFIAADYQTNGKGTQGNIWHSKAGENLLMSWILYPAFLSVSEQFKLSKAVSLAISDFLNMHSIENRIKWPNDIIGEDRKIGGILIENKVMGNVLGNSIVGIGLNINQMDFPDFPLPASSMKNITNSAFELKQSIKQLIDKLEYRYRQLEDGLFSKIDSEYEAKLYRLNKPSSFISNDKEFRGIIRGVSDLGELIIEIDSIQSVFGFHEIKMLY